MLLTVDFDEDFIDVEGVTLTSMFSFHLTSINSSEFDTPEADCFAADGDSSFSEEVFNIAMAQVETIVEPDSVRNYVTWGAPSGNRYRLYVFISRFYQFREVNLAVPYPDLIAPKRHSSIKRKLTCKYPAEYLSYP
ncbi:MAG: hypothetical protein ACI9B9_001273 [Halioglobus sp.]|jgi:hypothetical protein